MKARKRLGLRAFAGIAVVSGLVLSACGNDDGSSDSGASETTAAVQTTAAPAATTAPAATAAPAPEDVDTDASITIAVSTEPSTLDGQVANDRNARVVSGNLFESLIKRDRQAQLTPGLATSWQTVDESTWEFTLREGVVYHDGSPFTAESAAYSINRMVAEDFETQRGSYIRGILGAEVVDATTIHVLTDGPNAILPLQMAQVPMVPLDAGAEMSDEPVGTGPYKFESWSRGQSITAVRFDDYWGESAKIASFTVRVIPDAQTALAALQAGEVDLVLDILPDQADLAPKIESVPATEFSYIAFNTYIEELSDPRVRVAMNLAIDKELIADAVYSGFGRPNQAQHMTPESLGFNDQITSFPYDPDQARALLAEAGYTDGFSIELNVPIGRYLYGEETAQLVAQQLGDVGIDTEIVLWEWNEYRDAGRVKGTEEGAFDLKYGWNSNEWFDASRIASHLTCEGGSSKFCDPIVDENYEIGATNVDQDVRDQAYQTAWARINENPYSIFLLQQDLIYGLSEKLNWSPRLDDEYFVSEMSVSL